MALALSAESNTGVTPATTANPVTITAAAIGPAASDRNVIAGITHRNRTLITALTIGGVSATKASAADAGDFGTISEVWYAAVPTGTTADVVMTFGSNTNQLWCGVSLFKLTGSESSPASAPTATGTLVNSLAINPTIPTGGCLIAACSIADPASAAAWTNATEYADVDRIQVRDCSAYSTTAGSPTVTCDGADGVSYAISSAVFAEAASTGQPASKRMGGVPFAAMAGRRNVW